MLLAKASVPDSVSKYRSSSGVEMYPNSTNTPGMVVSRKTRKPA